MPVTQIRGASTRSNFFLKKELRVARNGMEEEGREERMGSE